MSGSNQIQEVVMLNKRRMGLLAVGCVVVFTSGLTCLPSIDVPGNGTLQILVTDQPFPIAFISEAVVTVTRVDIQEIEPSGDTDEGQENDQTGGSVTVFNNAQGQDLDLSALRNGQTQVLVTAQAPAAAYQRMRVFISGGRVTLTDGRAFDLTAPAGVSSGILLDAVFDVVKDQSTQLIVDFALPRLFETLPSNDVTDVGQIQGFQFSSSPLDAVRVVQSPGTGEITGTVTDAGNGAPIPSVIVEAVDAANITVDATFTDDSGAYVLSGLLPGTYAVEFSAVTFEPNELLDVVVVADQSTDGVNIALVSTPLP
jgi:hypothetical protein